MSRLAGWFRPSVSPITAYRLATAYFRHSDPWQGLPVRSVDRLIGLGVRASDFRWYFEGESQVPVESLDEMCEWLTDCSYVPDQALFHHGDYWQHPRTFEQIRAGDCEDHAIWAWRKLCELGYRARFYGGHTRTPESGANKNRHAWVVFDSDSQRYLLESVAGSRSDMVLQLSGARDYYVPHFSVDQDFSCHAYCGLVEFHLARPGPAELPDVVKPPASRAAPVPPRGSPSPGSIGHVPR